MQTIDGIEQARQLQSAVYLNVKANAGDMIKFASNGGNPVIEGILSSPNLDQLQTDITAARGMIKIHTL